MCSWSPELSDFLQRCLQKKPGDRPTARELLEHPFVKEAVDRIKAGGGRSALLESLAQDALPLVEAARREDPDQQLVNRVRSQARRLRDQ